MKDENVIFAFLVGLWIGSNQKTNKGTPIPATNTGTVARIPATRPGVLVTKPKPSTSFPFTTKPAKRPGVLDVTNYGRTS